ncbi:MAG: glycosyltransferase, partial [Micromonosporaceae bacterium]|nr:glycosyltransferase [Micromonosporaceae bacterium]
MRHNAPRCRLAIVSTYVPRRCGLATYTADLREALGVATDDVETVIVAIDRDGLTYGDEVLTTVNQDRIADYTSVVDILYDKKVDVVLIEHEYGIFGGPDGSNVLELASALSARGIPYMITLHTVLSSPSPGQAATLRALCAGAAKVTTFTETARRVAVRTGVAAGHQLVVVPHGAPVILRTAPEPGLLRPEIADLVVALQGRPTLTTFGLLSEGKGIDLAIEALAQVVLVDPRTQYVVAGATHPEVKRHSGESYRESLREKVRQHGLENNVHFVDAFLSLEDLSALLHASTLFVTPYRSPEQVCSGALTFALAAGLPVVSSAYRYAEDMLSGGAGIVVPIGDGDALAEAIASLLASPPKLNQAKAAAEAIASWLPWPTVAARKAELVREIATRAKVSGGTQPVLVAPPLVLDHLNRLTDEIGILQFSEGEEPSAASGYCVDDVARLAIVAADLLTAGFGPETKQGALAYRWLRQSIRFLSAAYDPSSRSMHNQLSYQGTWEDWPHLGDHVGRGMWGLGVLAGRLAVPVEVRAPASDLLDALAENTGELAKTGLRTAAYALLGLARAGRDEPAADLVDFLDCALRETTAEDPSWYWFEPELTYDNARLPQALLAGATLIGNQEAAARALTALDWYADHIRQPEGMIRCVGNVWHRRGDDPDRWRTDDGDEQPIDAGAFAEACAEAWLYRRLPSDAMLAGIGLSWFLGDNQAGVRMYVDRTGACHDGLSSSWVNANQGAESTLAYYQALFT